MSLESSFRVVENVPFSQLTTLEVGGPARYLARAESVAQLRQLLDFAGDRALPVYLLGEGSNLLVSDEGFPGLVLRFAEDEIEVLEDDGREVLLRVGSGRSWDSLVAYAVQRDLAGIECLSGIPGLVGAAPMQNIGAYGQEVAETIEHVDVVDRADGKVHRFTAAECGFGYRQSRFKGEWAGRYVVTHVVLRLVRGGAPAVRYGDLLGRFASSRPRLSEVRDEVLAVRRSKSMVRDPDDPNRRSAGSFFMNPIVTSAQADDVARRSGQQSMPRYPAGEEGSVKLSAAWLIERAGFDKGFSQGRAGLSSRHVLALINRGGARAEEIVTLAGLVRRGVRERFGVDLHPEPNFLGFDRSVDELLG